MLRVLFVATSFVAAAAAQTLFPPPPAPTSNPQTPDKVLLGMALFFEEQLSSTSQVACATCHDFAFGGVDPRTPAALNPGPDGVFGTADDQRGSPGVPQMGAGGAVSLHPVHGFGSNVTRRRAMTVLNSGYHTALGYEGGSATLEALAAVPILHSTEMAHAGRTWAQVVDKLAAARPLTLAIDLPPRLQTFLAGRSYPQLFEQAFGAGAVISQTTITRALASYLRTLNTDRSKWDLHRHGQYLLTEQEQLGIALFNSPANGATSCRTCHGDFEARVAQEGPVVGQMTMTTSGPYGSFFPTRLLFHNLGIRPIAEDRGRQNLTNLGGDGAKFRVASLRNVELTAPYFHNGSAATLRDVLDFYDRGGDFHVNQAAQLTPRGYTVAEKDALVAALRLLTDPRVAAGQLPFDRPRIGAATLRHAGDLGYGAPTATGPLVATAPFNPLVGESLFRVTLRGATPGAPLLLLLDTQAAAVVMPFGLGVAGSPSLVVAAAGVAQSSGTAFRGTSVLPMAIPNLPALSGQFLVAQWLAVEPALGEPLATSNALFLPIW
jgi:cytochrome c peroxidase